MAMDMSPQVSPIPEHPRWYAGIGSRETPQDVLQLMEEIAIELAHAGRGLRSGGARGADSAFERGAIEADGRREIFLPVAGYGRRQDGIDAASLPSAAEAEALAKTLHPAWDRLDAIGRRLMARNANQVLGAGLDDPVRFVLCWANGSRRRNGKIVDVAGGTGLACRLAASRGIEVFNLKDLDHRQRIEQWIERIRDERRSSPSP